MKNTLKFISCFCLFLVSGLISHTPLSGEEWAQPERVKAVLDGTCTEARASWWGFDAEDSTRFLQAAMNSGAKTLFVDRQSSAWTVMPLSAASNQEIILEDGVVIQAKRGEYHGNGDTLLKVASCENVVIRGEKPGATAVLRMWKADYQTDAYTPAEWRHGLSILSSKNIRVEDLTVEYTGGDGIYLGVCRRGITNSDVTIRRVDCNENHRQGISVISARNLLIEDTVMRNTNGTAPQAGIDFEPNLQDEELVNCVMRRCVCENNAGDGFEFYLPNLTAESAPISVTLEDCVSKGNARRGLAWMVGHNPNRDADVGPMTGTMFLKNFRTENEKQGGMMLRGNATDTVDFTAENVEIRNCDGPAIQFVSDSYAAEPFGDIALRNVKITYDAPAETAAQPASENASGTVSKDTSKNVSKNAPEKSEQPFILFQERSVDGLGLARITGNILCERAGKQEEITLGDEWIQKNYPVKNTRRLKTQRLHPESLVPVGTLEKPEADGMYVLPALRVRSNIRFLFYARKGEDIRFVLKLSKVVNRALDPVPLKMYGPAPSEKTFSLAPLPVNESSEYCVTAPETGMYILEAGPVIHSFILEKTSVPTALDATRLNLISSAGSVYFYVPAGTKDFAVCVTGEGAEHVRAALYGEQGEKETEIDDIEGVEFFYPLKSPAESGAKTASVRRMEFSRPTNGVFEDYTVRLQNIPPVLAFRPDFLFREVSPVAENPVRKE